MQRQHWTYRWLCATSLVALCAGCASTETAQKAADIALNQLSVYERDVSAKIKAEEDYYERVMDNASIQINRLREMELIIKLTRGAEKFADANKGKSAKQIAPKIPTLVEQSIDRWAEREAAYEKLLSETRETLIKNRKVLAIEREKISSLKTKLRSLTEGQSTADMLKFVIAFSKEVKTKLDELEDDAKKAADSASAKGGS